MRVVEANTRSPVALIACRNAGAGELRWGTRNGNLNGPSLSQTMTVAGKFDSAKKTIHVEKITAAAQ